MILNKIGVVKTLKYPNTLNTTLIPYNNPIVKLCGDCKVIRVSGYLFYK